MVVYKDGPFELWDLRTLSLLRTMPKKFPFVTALVSFNFEESCFIIISYIRSLGERLDTLVECSVK